ncbi:MAG: PAS domain-containing protein [Janthinobacterium lividum]
MSHDDLSHEHHVRRRAELVISGLRELWGEDLPPGPEAETVVLIDGLAIDDDQGRQLGLLVQSDAVPLNLLTRLLSADPGRREILEQLSPRLRARLDLEVETAEQERVAALKDPEGLPGTPSGVFALHDDPAVVDLDQRVSSLLGLPAQQHRLPWTRALDLVHPADRAVMSHLTRQAFRTQGSFSLRYRVVHEDGQSVWLSSVGHVLTGEQGGKGQVVGFTVPSP